MTLLVRSLLSFAVGAVVLLALFPAYGQDSAPPRCRSFLGAPVTCSDWGSPLATAAALVAAAVTWWLLARWARNRRRGRAYG